MLRSFCSSLSCVLFYPLLFFKQPNQSFLSINMWKLCERVALISIYSLFE